MATTNKATKTWTSAEGHRSRKKPRQAFARVMRCGFVGKRQGKPHRRGLNRQLTQWQDVQRGLNRWLTSRALDAGAQGSWGPRHPSAHKGSEGCRAVATGSMAARVAPHHATTPQQHDAQSPRCLRMASVASAAAVVPCFSAAASSAAYTSSAMPTCTAALTGQHAGGQAPLSTANQPPTQQAVRKQASTKRQQGAPSTP